MTNFVTYIVQWMFVTFCVFSDIQTDIMCIYHQALISVSAVTIKKTNVIGPELSYKVKGCNVSTRAHNLPEDAKHPRANYKPKS